MQSKKGYTDHQEMLVNREEYDWHPGDLPEHLSVLSSPILIVNKLTWFLWPAKG